MSLHDPPGQDPPQSAAFTAADEPADELRFDILRILVRRFAPRHQLVAVRRLPDVAPAPVPDRLANPLAPELIEPLGNAAPSSRTTRCLLDVDRPRLNRPG